MRYGAGVLMLILAEISGMLPPVCLEVQTFHCLTRAWKELFFDLCIELKARHLIHQLYLLKTDKDKRK